MRSKTQVYCTELSKEITKIDKESVGNDSSQLSFTHATSISWKIINGHKMGLGKKALIKSVIESLDVLHVQPENGSVKKSKFTHGQVERAIDVVNSILRFYWFPWSRIRKDLRNACK